jgi:RHS repeat-associated protein
VNKPGTLTVNGNAVTLDGGNNFSTSLVLPGGTQTVTMVAKDSVNNQRTNKYQINVTATNVSPTYDFDGNMLTDEKGNAYTWDAKNEMVKIVNGSNTYQFAYDGLGHRISETDNGTLTKQWVWAGDEMAEERDGSNNVKKRFFAQGFQTISGGTTTNYFYTRDHLGSIREVTDINGNVVARYDYDAYGRATLVYGTNIADFQYAGMYVHAATGLNFTLYRVYNANTGRWLSRDPLGEGWDATLYSYVRNNPINWIDPWGLDYTQTGGNLTLDTDGPGPHPNDPHHQNQLPPGAQGNAVPGVVAPAGHGIHVGDPATLIVNGHQVQCIVTDTTDNNHGINHEHRPESNTRAAQAAGLNVVNGPQGPMPNNGQPGNPNIPATIHFPTGHP